MMIISCGDESCVIAGAVVTRVAGSGSSGSLDGIGTAASFNGPEGIAIDSNGVMYVSEYASSIIRKITFSAGLYSVTTLAGTALATGSRDGSGSSALFYGPVQLAVSSNGLLYVGDFLGSKVRAIQTLTGNSPSILLHLWLINRINERAGYVTTVAGTSVLGYSDASPYGFTGPSGLALSSDQSQLYVVDGNGNRVVRAVTLYSKPTAGRICRICICGAEIA